MLRFKFIHFLLVLFILCFITSCNNDAPDNHADKTSVSKKVKKSTGKNKGDLVIRANESIEIESNSGNETQKPLNGDSEDDCKNTIGNEVKQTQKVVYDVAEQLPEFPGGLEALNKYIHDKTHDLVYMYDTDKSIRTMISFIVEIDGHTSNARVLKSSGNTQFDEDAKTIVLKMPEWVPAKNNGENVRMKYIVPVIYNPVQ